MSETKHTPGPWQRDGNMIYELMPNGFKRGIAQFKNKWWASITRDSGCTPEEFESVVCKLAAAPDMLAALEEAREALSHPPFVNSPTLKTIDAAIAKAKGETK
jgi:hypothetical protein